MTSFLIALTLLLSPSYQARFAVLGLKTNLLMLWVGFVLVYLLYDFLKNRRWQHWETNRSEVVLAVVFTLSAVASTLANHPGSSAIAQLIVLVLQPVLVFFLLPKDTATQNRFTRAALVLCGLLGAYAVVQYFTLAGLPTAYWGNPVEPKRATAVFTHPNFYALLVTPLLAYLLPETYAAFLKRNWITVAAWTLGVAGLLLSLSRAGWLGLAAAVGMFVLLSGNRQLRKLLLGAIAIVVIVVAVTPVLRYRVLLPFKREKSTVSRFSLWHTGLTAVKQSPLLGLGVTGFGDHWSTLNTDPNLEAHNYPHNIFLNFWVSTGLLGLLSVVGLMLLKIWRGIQLRTNPRYLAVALFLMALLVQGLADNPYFKNDLSLLFWIVMAL